MNLPRDGSNAGARSARATWAWAAVVGVLAFAYLAWGRRSERYFLDESYYLTQGLYADLLIEGRRDDPAWLSLAAIDHPPLAKALLLSQGKLSLI